MKRLKVLMMLLAVVGIAFGQTSDTWFLEELKMKADLGDAQSQWALGVCYREGIEGAMQDDKLAVHWFMKSAEQGHAKAQYCLGMCYEDGKGVARDGSEAVQWYVKAAVQGHMDAQTWLGFIYLDGRLGQPQVLEAAAAWFEKAGKQGNNMAQLCLGILYYEGKGLVNDYKRAVSIFEAALKSEQAYVSGAAAFYLSKCYRFGRGVPQDIAKADAFQKEALEKGWDEAKSLDDLLKDL